MPPPPDAIAGDPALAMNSQDNEKCGLVDVVDRTTKKDTGDVQETLANADDSKLQRLHELLDQTTLFAEFLQQQRLKAAAERAAQNTSNTTTGKRKNNSPLRDSKKRKLSQEAAAEAVSNPTLQALVTGKLRDYQIHGVEWLISLYENGLNGILADEMGLGKTIQVISFIAHLRSNGVFGPFLIVAPLSTLPQWVKEFAKWAPSIPVVMYHGNKDERSEKREAFLSTKYTEATPVVTTSYEIAMRDRAALSRQQWKYMVVDEGHRLKNLNCKLVNELKRYRTDNRLLLTGTPLQNNIKELWSLLNFLLPDIFDSLQRFETWFDFDEKTVENKEGQSHLIERERQDQIITKLHAILRPFVLRRVKSQVELKLPSKREVVLYTDLTPLQKHWYSAILRRDTDSLPGSTSVQNILMQLRKVCNHPYLIYEESSNETTSAIVSDCGKMQVLDQLIDHLRAGGHKVLIFSQMTRMLDILEDYMTWKGLKYCRIDGHVVSKERQSQMDEFNKPDSDYFCFLLSTRAGGLGINLTAADTVIIYDSDWNPTGDAQAQDRCHRIGQQRPVLVVRLITANSPDVPSVEVKMLTRATSKKKLEKLVIGKGNFMGRSASENTGAAVSLREKWSSSIKSMSLEELLDILVDKQNVPEKEEEKESDQKNSKKKIRQPLKLKQMDLTLSEPQLCELLRRDDDAFGKDGEMGIKRVFGPKADMLTGDSSFLDLFMGGKKSDGSMQRAQSTL